MSFLKADFWDELLLVIYQILLSSSNLQRAIGVQETEAWRTVNWVIELAKLEDHVMVTLAMKREGKRVNAQHIREKLVRDAEMEFSKKDVKNLLDSLKDRRLINERKGKYAITDRGRRWFKGRWREVEDDLNPSYLKTYRAKHYYPNVVDTLLKFCRGRKVSVFRVFTGRSWMQRKYKEKYITLKDEDDVERWVNLHGLDFLPYTHRSGDNRPEWLVIDFDRGEEVSLGNLKEVVKTTVGILNDFGIKPPIKFNGLEGFQTWTKFGPHGLPRDYDPLELGSDGRKRNFFSFYADLIRYLEARLGEELPGLTTSEVAHKKSRADRILLNPSIYKRFGVVRAPYSMHYESGLVSMPLHINELDDFEPKEADPDRVVERYREKGNEFKLKRVDGGKLFKAAVEWVKEQS
ncbi:hypothetical protein AKJ43_00730 [candidate division MSBL1 archaeon SCGC-AAA261D19]|uniref:DNA ligase D polymerase domain-containing protein n=1 Tax=candidate division MSBL1 archaeon SCGC-AAA261D19 TaxID=1698273 RepID=A0A133V8M1_9EURY|nr:hypothetical protein AKJ43_00730 [candidate division MSBL1 archaeon SCGC-AAA261D19]